MYHTDFSNLQNISDQALLKNTERLVQNERELLADILKHLHEIARRRLFSSLGFKSLFDYATRGLGYSEDQAYRRIQAMRLVKELPQIENQIASGEFTLMQLSQAASHFKNEEKILNRHIDQSEKISILNELKNKSTRETERLLISKKANPQLPTQPERLRTVSEHLTEIKFLVKTEIITKIEKLKGHLAHKHPHISIAQLFDQLCDLGLEHYMHEKLKRLPNKSPQPDNTPMLLNPVSGTKPTLPNALSGKSTCKTKYISQVTRRYIFKRARHQCENCKSTYALEIDHIKPRIFGGTNDPQNLRLLCRTCNQRAAIEQVGQKIMIAYLS